MHASIAKKLAKKMKRQAGFTLLEILVVLTIMGFLIAMVAPRLAGISTGAVDTVCDSNQSRTIQMVAAYFEKTGKFPNKLTNIVNEVATGDYELPDTSDGNPDNGAEALAEEFVERVKPVLHLLSVAEVKELNDLGITRVFNLNSDGVLAPMAEVVLDPKATAGTYAVMMSGIGANATVGTFVAADGLDKFGEAHFLGRIVMGLGPENGLITSGLVSNAAHCPGGIQNADNVTYNDYNIVLPRLAATVAQVETDGLIDDAVDELYIDGTQFVAFSYGEDFDGGAVTATLAPTTGLLTAVQVNGADSNEVTARLMNFEAQEPYMYATMCPEGHMFPADDNDFWAVDLDTAAGGNPAITVTP